MTKFKVGDRVHYVAGSAPDRRTGGTVVRVERATSARSSFFHVEWDDVDYTMFTASAYQAHDLRKQ